MQVDRRSIFAEGNEPDVTCCFSLVARSSLFFPPLLKEKLSALNAYVAAGDEYSAKWRKINQSTFPFFYDLSNSSLPCPRRSRWKVWKEGETGMGRYRGEMETERVREMVWRELCL